jgi:methylmalonyl-CoA mutase
VTLTAGRLANEFPPATRQDWLALVEGVLKGQSFERRLVRATRDGIAVQPLYTAETSSPAVGPLIGARDIGRPWQLRSTIAHPSPSEAARHALQDLENGAASLLVRIDPTGERGVAVADRTELAAALSGVLLDLAPVALDAGYLGPHAADWLGELGKSSPQAPLAFHMDPLSAFAETGTSPGPIESHLILAAETGVRWTGPYARASLFLATGRVVHEAGGSEGQELGFTLAAAVAYAKALTRAGLTLPEAFQRIVLGASVDATYFNGIAKLRALRLLWGKLTAACGVEMAATIEARSSARMLSTLDPWVNLLRLTAAGFAAGVGGADAVVLAPFTEPLGRPTDFARRQARNTQLVLMEEANLGRVADPAAGAWYLETLTDQIARTGWAAFQATETAGGVIAALQLGQIQDAVAQVRRQRQQDTATRKTGLIGVTDFPILEDQPVELDPTDPSAFARPTPRVQLPGPSGRVEPLVPWRLAEAFEALRDRAKALPVPPVALLATLGTSRDHAARVGFTQNALAAGGLSVNVRPASDIPRAEHPVAVLCGADEAYLAEGEGVARALKAAGVRHLLVAGRPSNQDALRACGVEGFIYAGADLVQILADCLEACA